MKKIILALVSVVILTGQVRAGVDIWCEAGSSPNEVIIYFGSDEPNGVRSFGLDITVSDGNITDVACTSPNYGLYRGSIKIDESGQVVDWGSCVCESPYGAALGGLDTNGVTIEMASLYFYEPNDRPAQSGELCRLSLDGCGFVEVTITENNCLGGVVMEDPDQIVDVDIYDCGECTCWGDISGPEGKPDCRVSTADVAKLIELLGSIIPPPPYYECMDLSGPTGCPDGILSTSDLGALLGYLGPLGPPYVGPCMPAPPCP